MSPIGLSTASPLKSRRLLVTASYLALAAAALVPQAAWAADHPAGDEASFKAAITAANADPAAIPTITLTGNITITDPATLPAATKRITLDNGGFNLSGASFNGIGPLTFTGSGEVQLAGSSTISGDISTQDGTVRLESGTLNVTRIFTNGTGHFIVGASGVATATNAVSANGTNGHITIEAGGEIHSTGFTVGAVSQVGVLDIDGPGSFLDTTSLNVATSGASAGTMNITGAGRAQAGSMSMGGSFVANAAPPQINISDAGSTLAVSGTLTFSTGSISVLNGGAFSADVVNSFGNLGDSNIQVRDSGSSFSTTGNLTFGSTSAAGTGILTVADGGALNVGGLLTLAPAGRTGVVNIGGAEGQAAAAAGSVNTALVTFGPGTGRLNFNHTETSYEFDAAIGGVGAINQVAGVTHLTGINTLFKGVTTISGGELHVDGTLGDVASTLTVNAGGLLGGSGTIGGAVTVSGGVLAPGNSPGTLTIVGDLVLDGASILQMEFGEADTPGDPLNDLIVVGGHLTLDGVLNVTQSAGGAFGDGVYRVIDYTGLLLNNTLNVGTLPSGSGTVQTAIANQINLVVTGAAPVGGGGGGGPTAPAPLNFWDAGGAAADGSISGGDGSWTASGGQGWTNAAGAANGAYANGGFAIFAAQSGLVTVDYSQGPVSASGLQFAADGYRIAGEPLSLAGAEATLRVGDGTSAGAAFTATVDAQLTGGARLVKTDGGTLVLTGVNDYSGGTRIEGGVLVGSATSFGAGAILDNATLVIDQATDAAFANAIDGAGGWVKRGAGRLTYTGSGALTGPTTVETGVLAVNGSLANSSVAVRSGATLTGSGAVGAVSAEAGGLIAPGDGVGTLSVGSLNQAAGSILQIQIDPTAGLADQLVVGGAAALANGAVLNVARVGSGTYSLGTVYSVLSAAGGVTGTYDLTGDVDRLSAFLGLADSYDANNVYLTVAQVRALAEAGTTPNQVATGGGADSLAPTNPVRQALVNLPDDAAARAAFDQLSGEPNASAKAVLVAQSGAVRDAAFARLADVACGDRTEGARGANCADVSDRAAGWAQVLGGWGEVDGRNGAANVDHDTAGFLTGLDLPAGGWRVGALAGYSRSTWDVDARYASGESDNYHLGAYAGGSRDKLNLRLGASYTWHDVSAQRSVAFADIAERLDADYDAGALQVFGDLGYRLERDGVSWEPFANLAHVRLRTDGFTERGGQTGLSASKDTAQTTLATLGVRPSMQVDLGSTRATLRGMLGWRHAFGDVVPTLSHAFAGGDSFAVRGASLARDAAALEAGADFALGRHGVASITYGGQFGDGVTDQRLRADIRITF